MPEFHFIWQWDRGKCSSQLDDDNVKTSLKLQLASSSTRIQFFSGVQNNTKLSWTERKTEKLAQSFFILAFFCFQINFYVNADIKNYIPKQFFVCFLKNPTFKAAEGTSTVSNE